MTLGRMILDVLARVSTDEIVATLPPSSEAGSMPHQSCFFVPELDVLFAIKYGFTREERLYVFGPAKAKGPDYPSETFRVLQKNEIARFGEYRTERLVLAAFDRVTGIG